MGPLIALLIIATVSLLIVRIGTTALMMTGLGRDTSGFQACSAFFGVGFTTQEAEYVVNHPVRRRIIRDLILFGNVGLTSALATIIITFLDAKSSSPAEVASHLGILAGAFITFVLLGKIGVIDKVIDFTIRKGLEKMGVVRAMDYEMVLKAKAGYCVSEVDVLSDHPYVGKALGDSRPADQGILVLGITPSQGEFRGAPKRHEVIQANDALLVYGLEKDILAFSKSSVT